MDILYITHYTCITINTLIHTLRSKLRPHDVRVMTAKTKPKMESIMREKKDLKSIHNINIQIIFQYL